MPAEGIPNVPVPEGCLVALMDEDASLEVAVEESRLQPELLLSLRGTQLVFLSVGRMSNQRNCSDPEGCSKPKLLSLVATSLDLSCKWANLGPRWALVNSKQMLCL